MSSQEERTLLEHHIAVRLPVPSCFIPGRMFITVPITVAAPVVLWNPLWWGTAAGVVTLSWFLSRPRVKCYDVLCRQGLYCYWDHGRRTYCGRSNSFDRRKREHGTSKRGEFVPYQCMKCEGECLEPCNEAERLLIQECKSAGQCEENKINR